MTISQRPVLYHDLLQIRQKIWSRWRRNEFAPGIVAELQQLREVNHKKKGYDFAQAHGIPVVPHQLFENIDEVFENDIPARCVIKPLSGHSSSGVYLLETLAGGAFQCHMHNCRFDAAADVIAHYKAAQERLGKGHIANDEVLLEKYVEDSLGFDVPLDYKVYGFKTGTPVVMQRYAPMHISKSDWSFAFYDAEGNRLESIRKNVNRTPTADLRKPHNFDEIIKVSKDFMAAAANLSFVRIDLFSTKDGVLFGEATPAPNRGKEQYTPKYEAILGKYWTDSLDALGLEYYDPD